MKYNSTILALLLISTGSYGQVGKALFSWADFMGRQAIHWDSVSTNRYTGALLGNGLLTANIYKANDRGICFETGRADVSGGLLSQTGLPTGRMVLKTTGKIIDSKLELDIYSASAKGSITTSAGTIQFTSFVPANSNVIYIRATGTKLEKNVNFEFIAEKTQEAGMEPRPAAVVKKVLNFSVCQQPLTTGGYATVWRSQRGVNENTVLIAVGNDVTGKQDEVKEGINSINAFLIAKLPAVTEAHRKWWRQYYQQNFISIPDQRMESFYWIHRYYFALEAKKGIAQLAPVSAAAPLVFDSAALYNEKLNQLFDRVNETNGFYTESGALKDSLASAAMTIPEMLLQSRDVKIKVFPAIAPSWKDVSFDKLSARGSFLISAKKENEETSFIKVYSLKGDTCQLQTDMKVNMVTSDKRSELSFTIFESEGKMNISFTTSPGETVFLAAGYQEDKIGIIPVKPALYANWRWRIK